MKLFKRVLIANRGEIAIRIIKTLKRLGIESVALFKDADEEALYVQKADFKVHLAGESLLDTYLNHKQIIEIAQEYSCDAIHPGYGFLSESSIFAKACKEQDVCFIGPHAEAIAVMGNKVAARNLAEEIGLPLPQGAQGEIEEILKQKDSLDYPVLIKAAGGGGGKGMQVAYDATELEKKIIHTSREAKSYFGNAEVFVEKYFERPRHIEIQVAADQMGNVVHFYERECSIQRRYQKIVEETPAPGLSRDLIKKMGLAAIELCKKVGYDSVGTVEFLMDKKEQFYFLEMNTRIQVEHAITEEVYSYDLIEIQIRSAAGIPLGIEQKDIQAKGHAIECRIYAEDPAQDFMPAPGKLWFYQAPTESKYIRVDSSLNTPAKISSFFDPMISKLVSWGEDRDQAIQRMYIALSKYMVYGTATNISYLRTLLKQFDFQQGFLSTAFCGEHHNIILREIAEEKEQIPLCFPILSYLLYGDIQSKQKYKERLDKPWYRLGDLQIGRKFYLKIGDQLLDTKLVDVERDRFLFEINGSEIFIQTMDLHENEMKVRVNDRILDIHIAEQFSGRACINLQGVSFFIERQDILLPRDETHQLTGNANGSDTVISPMPGRITELKVKEGDRVKKGDHLLTVEAMKMENNICSPAHGVVASLNVNSGDLVRANSPLLILKEDDSDEL